MKIRATTHCIMAAAAVALAACGDDGAKKSTFLSGSSIKNNDLVGVWIMEKDPTILFELHSDGRAAFMDLSDKACETMTYKLEDGLLFLPILNIPAINVAIVEIENKRTMILQDKENPDSVATSFKIADPQSEEAGLSCF